MDLDISGTYVCSYCPFEAKTQEAMQAHAETEHGALIACIEAATGAAAYALNLIRERQDKAFALAALVRKMAEIGPDYARADFWALAELLDKWAMCEV